MTHRSAITLPGLQASEGLDDSQKLPVHTAVVLTRALVSSAAGACLQEDHASGGSSFQRPVASFLHQMHVNVNDKTLHAVNHWQSAVVNQDAAWIE